MPRQSVSQSPQATFLRDAATQREAGKADAVLEFRADKSTSTYYLHVLVSSDGQRRTLRAKLLYDPVYLCVPVVEDGKVCPWNKPAFVEICDAIQHASV